MLGKKPFSRYNEQTIKRSQPLAEATNNFRETQA